jgi:hypothetical protein
MLNLGMAVYIWGPRHQDRLMLECLAPAVAQLRQQGLVSGFLVDRYDARGPHLFAVLIVPSEAAPEIADQLAARLEEHLTAHPSSEILTPKQLARRHAATRQRQQCEVDKRPGFAANNSFEIFEHPAHGYPFQLSATLAREEDKEDLWDLLADLTLWTIGQLAVQPGSPAMATGLRWVASVARELRLSGVPPADYWRHHAVTLLPDLFSGRGPDDETTMLSALAVDIGVRNPVFARAWQETAETGPVWPRLPGMVRLILDGHPGLASPWPLLREIDHTVLKQLGLPTALQIPMVLYAWRQSAS